MRPTISSVRGLGDFATVYQWNVTMPKPPTTGLSISANDITSEFNLRCFSTEIPKKAPAGNIDIWIRGHHIKQAGIYDPPHTLTLIFLETVDNVISNFMRELRELCWQSKTGVQTPKSSAEFTLRLSRLDRQDREIWEYILIGCFLEDYDPSGGAALDGSTSDILRPSLIISYDDFEDSPL